MCNGSTGAEGAPRVVDRLGIGSVAIGIESFADMVTRHVYVDKTLVIRDLVDRGGVTLFCRPRRFGKSLLLRTLQCYFEAPVASEIEDAGPLFDGLAIMGAEERHVAERGAHADKVGELAKWYDGYSFGGEEVYNPWSVLNYFFHDCAA